MAALLLVLVGASGGLERGFANYDAKFPQLEAARKIPERNATATTDSALNMLDRLGRENAQPLFLWVHYQDPHGPYTPPEDFRSWVSARETLPDPDEQQLPFGRDRVGLGAIPPYQRIGDHRDTAYYRIGYEAEIRYTDAEIGRLLEGLKQRGLYDDTVVAFAADHGESLGEHNFWFAHGRFLHDALMRVPLFIRVPGRTPARRSDVTGLVDLLPTLLSALGVASPSGLAGRNLLSENARLEPTTPYMATLASSKSMRFSVVAGRLKYQIEISEGADPREELFRLDGDGEDLASRAPRKLNRMREVLRTLRSNFPSVPGKQRTFGVDDAENLRALGYLD